VTLIRGETVRHTNIVMLLLLSFIKLLLHEQYNTIQYTVLAVNIYMFVATNVCVAGDTINNIYIITYNTEEQIDTYFTLTYLYA
jgi:hypothetical protein